MASEVRTKALSHRVNEIAKRIEEAKSQIIQYADKIEHYEVVLEVCEAELVAVKKLMEVE